ncbi:MAG: hypothetical protein ACE5JP_15910 [Candidatus Bipolaricaulia bacterium]
MHTIRQLSGILGLSVNQVRNRIDALSSEFKRYTRRGQNNRLIVDSTGLKLLQRVVELEQTGQAMNEAVEAVKREARVSETVKQDETGATGELVAELRARLEDKDREIATLERQLEERNRDVAHLYDLMNRILPSREAKAEARAESVTEVVAEDEEVEPEPEPKKPRRRGLRPLWKRRR